MFDSKTVHFLPSGGGWWDLVCVCDPEIEMADNFGGCQKIRLKRGNMRKYGGGGGNKIIPSSI